MDLHEAYRSRKYLIKQRLSEFKRVSPSNYFYELCFCLLTPQSNGRRCDEAVQELIKRNFQHTSIRLIPLLKQKTRFHHTKARHLTLMKKQYPTIHSALLKEQDPFILRAWLVKHVKGIGMKEASHFLRNIGFTGLAILDRHILKNLQWYGCIRELPQPLTTEKYLELEKQFIHFSNTVNIPMDELDLLFWSMETGEVFK